MFSRPVLFTNGGGCFVVGEGVVVVDVEKISWVTSASCDGDFDDLTLSARMISKYLFNNKYPNRFWYSFMLISLEPLPMIN